MSLIEKEKIKKLLRKKILITKISQKKEEIKKEDITLLMIFNIETQKNQILMKEEESIMMIMKRSKDRDPDPDPDPIPKITKKMQIKQILMKKPKILLTSL